MKISTRGRYALRVMTDMAEHSSEGYIPLKAIAERQEISRKYIESIMVELSKAGLVDGKHGKGGGYKLGKNPEDFTVLEILKATEGDMAPVECLTPCAKSCARMSDCRTVDMWRGFYKLTEEYFRKITLKDLSLKPSVYDFVI